MIKRKKNRCGVWSIRNAVDSSILTTIKRKKDRCGMLVPDQSEIVENSQRLKERKVVVGMSTRIERKKNCCTQEDKGMSIGIEKTEPEDYLLMNGLLKAQGASKRLKDKESKLDRIIRLAELELHNLDLDMRIGVDFRQSGNTIVKVKDTMDAGDAMKEAKRGLRFWRLMWKGVMPGVEVESIYVSNIIPSLVYPRKLIDAYVSIKAMLVPCIADMFYRVAEVCEEMSESFEECYEYETPGAVEFKKWIDEEIKKGDAK